jgi:hypothetical protein
VTSAHIDISRLSSLIDGIWTIEEAQAAFSADFTKPVSSDIKNHLWQAIQIANRFKMFYPQTKVTGMRYVNPGNGGGNRHP